MVGKEGSWEGTEGTRGHELSKIIVTRGGCMVKGLTLLLLHSPLLTYGVLLNRSSDSTRVVVINMRSYAAE